MTESVPAPVSVREQLLAAITTAVGGVYGLPTPEDERDMPVTIVQDGTDECTTRYDATHASMPVAVARAEAANSDARSDKRAQANEALAQLIVDMQADPTFGGLADGVDLVGGGINVELNKLVFAEASFTVRYHTVRGNPYLVEPAIEDEA